MNTTDNIATGLGESAKHEISNRAQITRRMDAHPAVAGLLPVWIRAPRSGAEHFCGLSRAKLYELTGKGHIRSVSIREPGQFRGVRLFELASILQFIERQDDTTTQ